jgi:peptidoglycan/LPS O-acetylase OafA/YrhL
MKKEQQRNLIIWIKRIAAVATVVVWAYTMYIFLKDPAPFAELAPYCMGSTMLIFGILTGIFKGLEYWEQQIGK